MDNHIQFKLSRVNEVYVVKHINTVSTLKNRLNGMLAWYMIQQGLDKAWSSHSFRHTIITQLIKAHGIEKTAKFIGHKTVATTQLYDKAKESTKLLKDMAQTI